MAQNKTLNCLGGKKSSSKRSEKVKELIRFGVLSWVNSTTQEQKQL